MENLVVNYLRVNSINMIAEANSGHPGICLGAAPIMYTIYKNAFINPEDPKFFNRDRIIMSAGHGSALVYSTLGAYGFGLTEKDYKGFRKLGTNTPGHPEYGVTSGVDATTGPLGQGVANAVGMAIAERNLAAKFNVSGFDIVDHYTYCLCGDGCLMEGVAQEAISLAGNLKLNKLILFYDDNNITIQGKRTLANSEDSSAKFEAMGWSVLHVEDGNDLVALQRALDNAKKSKDKPTVIIVKTHIGFGSELQDNEKCHGNPFKKEQIEVIKQNLGYDYPDWTIPKAAQKILDSQLKQKKKQYAAYKKLVAKYEKKCGASSSNLALYQSKDLTNVTSIVGQDKSRFDKAMSTRDIGGIVLNDIAQHVPNMLGGCADVTSSTRVEIIDGGVFSSQNPAGKNIYFGIREHAMGSICNGIALHGGLNTFCSTYLAFENYMTPSVRMSALSGLPVTYVFTHDSIAAGEDGPTHQPIEQIATLRAMPNINVFRPFNYNEVAFAYQTALRSECPTAILLTRQSVEPNHTLNKDMDKGAYVIAKAKSPKVTLVGSGSEVDILLKAQKLLKDKKIEANVVSMLCEELFDAQADSYKNKVINPKTLVVTMEASSDNMWYKYATNTNCAILQKQFGASGNYKEVYKHFGFTEDRVVQTVLDNIKAVKK